MDRYKVLKAEADAACLGRRYEEAAKLYGDAILILNQNESDVCTRAAVHSNRCMCYIHLQRANDAWDDAQIALSLRPRWPKAHLRAAQCHELQGNLEQAIASYQRSSELDPSLEGEVSIQIKLLRSKLARELCHAIFLPPTPSPKPKTARPPVIYHAALCPQTISLGSISTRILAGAYADGSIRLWCTTLGTLLHTLTGHTQAVTTLGWSGDGSLLASGSLDTEARIWQRDLTTTNSVSFTALSVLQGGHSGRVSAVAFGGTGTGTACDESSQLVITVSTDLTVRVWNPRTGECLHTLGGHSALVADIALDPGQGTLLASASGDTHFKLWDIHTGTCLENVGWDSGPVVLCGFLPSRKESASKTVGTSAARSAPPGPLLLTAHAQLMRQEGRVLLWDVLDKKDGWLNGRLVAPSWSIDGLVGRPTSWDACITSDDLVLLAVASADGAVRVWDVTNGPLELFGFEVENNNSSRNGGNPELPAWQAAALTQAANVKNLVKFSPGGGMLAASGATHVISIRNVDSGREIYALGGHTGRIRALEWVDSEILVSASEDGSMRKWRLAEKISTT